jgi:hypothetical protein
VAGFGHDDLGGGLLGDSWVMPAMGGMR